MDCCSRTIWRYFVYIWQRKQKFGSPPGQTRRGTAGIRVHGRRCGQRRYRSEREALRRARGRKRGHFYRVKRFVSACLVNVHTNYKTPFFVLEIFFLFFLKNLFKPCLFMRRRQEKSKEGRGGGRGESCSDCFCGEGARRKHTSRRRGCRRQVGPGARLRPELCRARILPLLRRRSGWRWVDAELEGPLRGQIGTTYVPTQSRRRTHSHSLPPVGRRRACAPSSAGTNLDRREELLALRRGASPPR